jgi:hypothetical protein
MTLTTMPRPATRARDTAAVMMKAFVYGGPGKKARPTSVGYMPDRLRHSVESFPQVSLR